VLVTGTAAVLVEEETTAVETGTTGAAEAKKKAGAREEVEEDDEIFSKGKLISSHKVGKLCSHTVGTCPAPASASCVARSAAAIDVYPPGSTFGAAAATTAGGNPASPTTRTRAFDIGHSRGTSIAATPPVPLYRPTRTRDAPADHSIGVCAAVRVSASVLPDVAATRTFISVRKLCNDFSHAPAATTLATTSSIGTSPGVKETDFTAVDPG
jgi:hypothetical protein